MTQIGGIDESEALRANMKSVEGRPSAIQEYCLAAINKGHTQCLWLCMESHGRTLAKDIPLASENGCLVTMVDVRKQCGWWKRYSLYSATGIEEVMIRFLDFDDLTSNIAVVTKPFNYKRSVKKHDRRVQEAWDFDMDPCECGVNIMGIGHDKDDPKCAHSKIDRITTEFFCRVQYARDIEAQSDENEWLSPLLKYYWRNGIGLKGFIFLEGTGFVTSYSNLCVDTFNDAARPYGKTVNGFMLVEGWRIRYLLCLVAASLVCSICIAAIGWVYDRSMEAGLTAGTYAVAVTAVPLGVLTFLSAVL